jgi:prolyl oligopeptidase
VVELISEFEASYSFVDNDGTLFWFRTDLNAPKGRLIAIDIAQSERSHWQEIIPEGNDTLEGVGVLNHQFVADFLKDARGGDLCAPRGTTEVIARRIMSQRNGRKEMIRE